MDPASTTDPLRRVTQLLGNVMLTSEETGRTSALSSLLRGEETNYGPVNAVGTAHGRNQRNADFFSEKTMSGNAKGNNSRSNNNEHVMASTKDKIQSIIQLQSQRVCNSKSQDNHRAHTGKSSSSSAIGGTTKLEFKPIRKLKNITAVASVNVFSHHEALPKETEKSETPTVAAMNRPVYQTDWGSFNNNDSAGTFSYFPNHVVSSTDTSSPSITFNPGSFNASASETVALGASQYSSNNGANVPTTPKQDMKQLLEQYRRQQEAVRFQLAQEQQKEVARINAPKELFKRGKVPTSILEQTRGLPIYSLKNELLELVKKNQFVIVIGETGSGKSTQIPQYLADAGLFGTKKIGVTQPRRVAAKSLADRVAKECGVKVGTSVGYAVRFDKNVSTDTVIKYMTDGLLVKECTTEANLESYSVIIIDEAHERSIHTDVCFGLLKRAARNRPDLKIIISSATLEQEKFSKYFNNAPIFRVSGKAYNVEIVYNPKTEYDFINGAVDTIFSINRREPRGDILVFLSGQDEIEQLWDMLDAKMRENSSTLYDELIITPCYGALDMDEQQKIFEETPPNCRKVVLATNIAETSLTIDGIVYVIDCGFYKEKQYNPKSGINSLVRQRITKFQAIQRAGRAGRTRDGKCYRLYTEREFKVTMKQAVAPEITRCNVESVVLDLICMGIANPVEFEFMDRPPETAIMEAIDHLQELSALDNDLKLTYWGRRMSEFPLDPPLAKVVIESEKLGCSSAVLKIVGLLSTQYQNLFARGKKVRSLADANKARFNDTEGDLLTLLKVYDAWLINNSSEKWCKSMCIQYRHLMEAEDIRLQLKDILNSRGISQGYQKGTVCPSHMVSENIRRSFTAGYFRQLAKKKVTGYAYKVLADAFGMEDVFLHPSSSLFSSKHPWVIYHEVIKTNKAYMRGVIAIQPEWITEYAPQFAKKIALFM